MIRPHTQPYQLWRYDISLPPDMWSTDYHSEEYTYPEAIGSLRFKNQIHAGFFYDDKVQAFLTGSTAAKKKGLQKFWLTSTFLMPTLNLLDLRFHYNGTEKVVHDTPLKIIFRLEKIGIDVLTDDYCRFDDFGGKTTSLSDIKSTFEEIMILDEIQNKCYTKLSKVLDLANDFNTFFHKNIAYVGQLLTDFSNGPVFKEALQSKNIDGYIFEDEIHTHKPTYCLFDFSKLSAPKHEPAYV